jgi:2-keto-4-pentenoate hydratase
VSDAAPSIRTAAPSNAVEAAARRLRETYASGQPCAPVRDLIGASNLDDAYAVQECNTRHWLAAGRRLVGRKIGLTAKIVQQQLGVAEPDYGMLFADMAVLDCEDVPMRDMLQPRVEGEVALCLGRDLRDPQITIADMMRAVEYAVAAVEIVDSRVAGWDIKIADTVADNASSGRYVLGTEPRRLGDFDLRLCGMVLERRGEGVSFGAGAACLGNPLNAALWLARKMAAAGRPLLAGDTVLSGALGPMVAVQPGDVFALRINGLGAVRVAFSAQRDAPP